MLARPNSGPQQVRTAPCWPGFGFAEKDPVRLVGAPAPCTASIEKPHDGNFPTTLRLDQAFSFATSEANIGMGASFANRISVHCP